MNHLYLFALEIEPLEIGKVYDELPSHLTLMSRFLSNLTPKEISVVVWSLFDAAGPIDLTFESTIELGPKKVIAHMISSPAEQILHENLCALLEAAGVTFQYPQFIGAGHRAHVTQRDDVDFPPKSQFKSTAAYLIEVVDGHRIIRSSFNLS